MTRKILWGRNQLERKNIFTAVKFVYSGDFSSFYFLPVFSRLIPTPPCCVRPTLKIWKGVEGKLIKCCYFTSFFTAVFSIPRSHVILSVYPTSEKLVHRNIVSLVRIFIPGTVHPVLHIMNRGSFHF